MKEIPNASIDMVLCDLPYGTTACRWDSVIPFIPLWAEYHRVCKRGAAIVLTASQPFTSALVMSNPAKFRHDWVWEKTSASGFLNAKKAPLRAHESVLVFCDKTPTYSPQKSAGHTRKVSTASHRRNSRKTENYGTYGEASYDSTERYPRSVLKFRHDRQKSALHPTQKPVALMEYLIRTYSHEGQVVLDNAMGSGTTGVACASTGRDFIGIELDQKYFEVAKKRIDHAFAKLLTEVSFDA